MQLLPEAASTVPLITLLNSNKRRIENMDQIHAHLLENFPSASYSRLESSDLEALSIRDKVWGFLQLHSLQHVLCAAIVLLLALIDNICEMSHDMSCLNRQFARSLSAADCRPPSSTLLHTGYGLCLVNQCLQKHPCMKSSSCQSPLL